MIQYDYFTSFDKKNSKLKGYLKWWSNKTVKEPRMLPKTAKFLRNNLVYAVLAFKDGVLIGAAGLIPCLNRHGEKMFHDGKLVVELASNYVDSDFRDRHIGTFFVTERLSFCKKSNLFPVSVTGSSEIKTIFEHIAIPMKDVKEYHDIYKEVRVCECHENDKPSCKICPLKDKAIWVFKEF
jgi:hypothetical protein